MSKIFANNAHDVLAWNFRGCSGEINKQLRFYHSGATDDLGTIVQHAASHGYEDIYLIGFSLGGNMTLKYLGEQGDNLSELIKKAVVFSVPLHLHGSSQEISKAHNILYAKRFLRNLRKKVKDKAALRPGDLNVDPLSTISTIIEFDDEYTAPIHGYKDAIDYYNQCSSINFISDICIPTLIVNALNDSFLSEECYPFELIKTLDQVFLETPKRGGHCGFPGTNEEGHYWSETRALEFISQD
jgi:predicted alpha/beta-fold hydrolase